MLGKTIALGAALLAVLQLIVRFIDVIALMVMARLLVPDDFGLIALAVSVQLIAGAVTELNVSDALVRRKSIEQQDLNTAFTMSLIRGGMVMSILLASAVPMAMIYKDERLAYVLAAMAAGPLLMSLASPAMISYLHRLEYGPGARLQIVGKVGGVSVGIGLALATHSYWALVAGQLATQLITTVYSYRLAPYRPRLSLQGWRSILSFAGWMTTSRIISTVNLQSDRFLIGHLLGKGPLGQYTIGSDLSSMVTYAFAGPIMQTTFAGFSKIQDDPARLRLAYLKCQQMLVIVLMPLGFGLAILADRLIPLVLGPNWGDAILVIQWLAPVISLQVLYMPMLSLAMAVGQPRILVQREAINLAVRLPATVLGAIYFGLIGAVIARAAGAFLVIALTLFMAKRFVQVSVGLQIVNIWRSLLSVGVMLIGILLLKWALPPQSTMVNQLLQLVLFCLLGGSLYLLTHFLAWRLTGLQDGAESFIVDIVRRRSRDPGQLS